MEEDKPIHPPGLKKNKKNLKNSPMLIWKIIKHLKFTSLSLLIISGIQRTSLIVIKSLREDNHPAARVILEIQTDSLNEHRACTNLHVTILITVMNAEIRLTIKERKQH